MNRVETTVIIPTYNRPRLLKRAIESVLNQTYQNFEIIIVDDSSSTDSASVSSEFNDRRIKHIHNTAFRSGFIEAKNQGIRESNHDSSFIAFLDDDDEYLSEFLEKSVAFLKKDSDTAAVTTNALFKTQSGEDIGVYPRDDSHFYKIAVGNGWVVRKSIFYEDNIWLDKNIIFEDLDFGVRLGAMHKLHCLPDVLRIYYGYPEVSGDSRSTILKKESASVATIEAFLEKNKEIYRRSGSEALAWVYLLTGKWLLRAGHIKRGRSILRKAFRLQPSPKNLFFYAVSLIFPSAFSNVSYMVIKNRLIKRW
ncbi:MAG: glycosyltransferase family 2 protein [Patescibacteria group bacterium]|nr:glycosyltransferase family 2 protein [Patescibacteria group bacterium]MDE2101355.1 glycosyltransferase family 2 protein [Patescibacteria group bacterium]